MSYIFALFLCVLRIYGEKGVFFQAIAHFYVAWLFAGAYYGGKKSFLYQAVGMSLVEISCFLYEILATSFL